jgi:hypothetical protein
MQNGHKAQQTIFSSPALASLGMKLRSHASHWYLGSLLLYLLWLAFALLTVLSLILY